MNAWCLLLPVWMGLAGEGQAAKSELPPAEYGHGLTAEQAGSGWISLFDGETAFGWIDAKVERGALVGGKTSAHFADCELRGEVVHGGVLTIGGKKTAIAAGKFEKRASGPAGPVELGDGVALRTLLLRPLGLKPIFNGKDLAGWERLPGPVAGDKERAVWTVENGMIHVVGGGGSIEYQERYGDFVLQLDIRTRTRHANSGVFFRNLPGVCLMGYESQILNRCKDNDPARPLGYSTGAIDDRKPARRLVSRDFDFFKMTVVANGPHLATWGNGYQLIDWTDTRPKHDNPRRGLRTEPGTIQFQAHDPKTNVEFKNIVVAELKKPES